MKRFLASALAALGLLASCSSGAGDELANCRITEAGETNPFTEVNSTRPDGDSIHYYRDASGTASYKITGDYEEQMRAIDSDHRLDLTYEIAVFDNNANRLSLPVGRLTDKYSSLPDEDKVQGEGWAATFEDDEYYPGASYVYVEIGAEPDPDVLEVTGVLYGPKLMNATDCRVTAMVVEEVIVGDAAQVRNPVVDLLDGAG